MTVLKVIANKSAAALAFAALVAIQTSVGLVYRFSQQTNGSYAFSQASALAISEVIKFFIAAVMFHHSMRDRSDYPSPGVGTRTSRLRNLYAELRAQLSNRLLALLAGLALSYAINNHVAFALYQLADPGTIQLVKSGSTFISAIFLCLALGRHVSKLQWLAILLQASGLISTQYREDSDATVQPLCTYSFLLLSTTITSVNSCWNDYLCKNYSASLPAQNMGLYASGAVINIVIFCFKSAFGDEPGFFAGYNNPLALVVILLNSCIGVAITFVYKYADAVIKSIAGSVTTALLVVLSAILFGAKITVLTGTGSLIIFISTYIYMVHAPIPAATQRRDGRQAQALVTASSDTDLKTKGPTATQLKPRRRIKLAVCFGVCLIVVLTTLAVPGER
ncbi:nucleotide-sugar transporter-domain-containing protein [Geranomyces variabilis]|nr:nucleotide-sugar transporter-domain-containing protein [Geranomyces variabilis]